MNKSCRSIGRWVHCGLLMSALPFAVIDGVSAAPDVDPKPAQPVIANHTIPKIVPPKTTLEFSPSPTLEEISRVRVFEEPLVPMGGEPSPLENVALAAALVGYTKRSGPDDFSSLTTFLDQHPQSPWRAALLTGLGTEYYNTAHYSLALEAWRQGWEASTNASDANGVSIANRALGELAYMYTRLGRMTELEALLKSINGRILFGPETEKIAGAREGLWTMKNRPQEAFRCGPLALHQIKRRVDPQHPATDIIRDSASTQKGCSLVQVAELSKKIGLNYQMAFRQKDGAFIVPSVVHWKLGHYAAMVQQVENRYLVQDPTFKNNVWATQQALEDESSGYFLVPPGPLPSGWRAVTAQEGETIWGKGTTSNNDAGPITRRDLKKGSPVCRGMLVPSVHLMDVNLGLVDEPVGYNPPVGPPIPFTVRYNARDSFYPSLIDTTPFGYKWTCDWASWITDNPQSPLADVTCYMGGGGTRSFTGFDTNTQSFQYQQYDLTLLTRTSTNPISYRMRWPDGLQFIFSQSDGSAGTSRRILLSQVVDPQGNAATLTYQTAVFGILQLVAITDAIGQVTTLTYGTGVLSYKLVQVTDPFSRSATFDYVLHQVGSYTCGSPPHACPIYAYQLYSITDVQGMTSQVTYAPYEEPVVTSLITPYGTNIFNTGETGTIRWVETIYPDGSRDRVEFNQTLGLIPDVDPPSIVPQGMNAFDGFLSSRTTYYWDRNAYAIAHGDYSKARIFHWLHAEDLETCSGILGSTKAPLEHRIYYDYVGQHSFPQVGANNRPTHIGRVLDDGSTQLYTYGYNGFGNPTNAVDPLGRTFSYTYAPNGIDLLEIRQTRAGNNELLFKATYNSQHLPLTQTDAAGQTTTYSYNARGQLLSITNARNETLAFAYDPNGYLLTATGPLPGTNDTVTATYDSFGRTRTVTDVSGYTSTFDYNNLDRITRITHPDSTYEAVTYDRLDPNVMRDRAGRLIFLNHDSLRQLTQVTDPLGRATRLDWCGCGTIKSLTDPMGRTTSWLMDVQGRKTAKQYADGSQVRFIYENSTSRLRQVVDERQQLTVFSYNRDDRLASIHYANTAVATPNVIFMYDPNYERLASATDGIGTTVYSYYPITGSPTLGASQLASVTGPLPHQLVTYSYDELGRPVHRTMDGADSVRALDPVGRIVGVSNALGAFHYTYDGASRRLLLAILPNGQTGGFGYGGPL
jgi:YD repeat-containing protein